MLLLAKDCFLCSASSNKDILLKLVCHCVLHLERNEIQK